MRVIDPHRFANDETPGSAGGLVTSGDAGECRGHRRSREADVPAAAVGV